MLVREVRLLEFYPTLYFLVFLIVTEEVFPLFSLWTSWKNSHH